jgi:hypothetical protein
MKDRISQLSEQRQTMSLDKSNHPDAIAILDMPIRMVPSVSIKPANILFSRGEPVIPTLG